MLLYLFWPLYYLLFFAPLFLHYLSTICPLHFKFPRNMASKLLMVVAVKNHILPWKICWKEFDKQSQLKCICEFSDGWYKLLCMVVLWFMIDRILLIKENGYWCQQKGWTCLQTGSSRAEERCWRPKNLVSLFFKICISNASPFYMHIILWVAVLFKRKGLWHVQFSVKPLNLVFISSLY